VAFQNSNGQAINQREQVPKDEVGMRINRELARALIPGMIKRNPRMVFPALFFCLPRSVDSVRSSLFFYQSRVFLLFTRAAHLWTPLIDNYGCTF
jgi:hypothetical protein